MNRWICATLLVLAAVPWRAADAAGAAGRDALRGRLVITGSNTMAPLVSAIARRFVALHPGVAIEVQPGGTGRGLDDARRGAADVGMVSRALGDAERDMQGLPIARDGVALVVHKDNPVSGLTDRQVVGIYTGRITRWSEVGGRDAPIVAYEAAGARASAELFASYFGLAREAIQARPAAGIGAARLRLVAENRDAILYMSVGLAERAAESGAPIRMLPAGGIAATSRNIRNGHFPISRPLTLATRARPGALAKAFVDYCGTSQITDLVLEHDFVPYLD
ncbi:MAG TPA: phosphate ABC transporter substrate-binding protein [Albitalea sp.]